MKKFEYDYDVRCFLRESEWETVVDTWRQIVREYTEPDILKQVPLKHFSKFGYSQFHFVEPWKFRYVQLDQAQSLTHEQLSVLSPQQVCHLNFQYLSPAQLSSFTYEQISLKKMEQLNELTVLQLTPLLKTIISSPELSVIKELKD